MSSAKVFSLEGRGLRLNTAADVEPYIKALGDNNEVEEIRLGGNTLGIEACEALAKVLETKKTLQVQYHLGVWKSENSALFRSWIGCTFALTFSLLLDRQLSRHIYISPAQ